MSYLHIISKLKQLFELLLTFKNFLFLVKCLLEA